jgi:hypothetical protein
MAASIETVREIVKMLRRHVDQATLEKMINELLDVPGNKELSRHDRDAGARVAEEITICRACDPHGSAWSTTQRVSHIPASALLQGLRLPPPT